MHIFLEVILFIVVLVVLIVVHELGHFIVAKLSGMRVDEFGIGYPPRALRFAKIGDTEYTLNWIPFGGFVRIAGEDGDMQMPENGDGAAVAVQSDSRSFSAKPRILQALTLIAGIVMNLLLAYIIITITLVLGTQQILSPQQAAQDSHSQIAIEAVQPDSPADKAGFEVGDIVKSAGVRTEHLLTSYDQNNPSAITALTGSDTTGSPMIFSIDRNGQLLTITVVPRQNVIASDPTHYALGVGLASVDIVKTPILQAPVEGAQITVLATESTAIGLYELFKGIVTFSADLSQVSGPVGIAGAVGHASAQGIVSLLTLVAIISINLAIINLLPIPALDGGRLLFVIIEAITRRRISPKIAERVNFVGFALLLILMVVVTGHDIFKLFV